MSPRTPGTVARVPTTPDGPACTETPLMILPRRDRTRALWPWIITLLLGAIATLSAIYIGAREAVVIVLGAGAAILVVLHLLAWRRRMGELETLNAQLIAALRGFRIELSERM